MIFELENTDLLTANVEAIAHCCNCFNTMGSGIARQIREKFPEAYFVDCKTTKGDKTKFGSFSDCLVQSHDSNPHLKYIYNLYGQYYYGTDKRYLDYESIYSALDKMAASCLYKNLKTIGFPKNMGCTLAGGSWPIVNEMIKHLFAEKFDVYICQYSK
jgi:O-acetyl-ADP-ribose deacetylase (regulator of RNase III)